MTDLDIVIKAAEKTLEALRANADSVMNNLVASTFAVFIAQLELIQSQETPQ